MKNKIIMIAPTPFFSDRGCHIRVLNSYLRLKREGNEIILLTYSLGRNLEGLNIKRIPSLPGYKKLDPGFSLYKPFLDLFLLIYLEYYYLRYRPTMLYCHLHEGALAGIMVKGLFRKVKIIFDSQGSLSGELVSNGTVKNGLLIKILNSIELFLVKHSNIVITSTKGLKKRYESMVPGKKLEVEPDYPDKSLFNPQVLPIELEKGTLPQQKIVAYLGGLKRNKGIGYLLDSIVHTSGNIHFLLMGYPLDEVGNSLKEMGIEDRVTLIGPIPYEKAASYLKLADAAVSPKVLSESGEANAKLYIYDAVGLPVVCFDSKENREVLNNRGFFAKEKDPVDLALKIEMACGISKRAKK